MKTTPSAPLSQIKFHSFNPNSYTHSTGGKIPGVGMISTRRFVSASPSSSLFLCSGVNYPWATVPVRKCLLWRGLSTSYSPWGISICPSMVLHGLQGIQALWRFLYLYGQLCRSGCFFAACSSVLYTTTIEKAATGRATSLSGISRATGYIWWGHYGVS